MGGLRAVAAAEAAAAARCPPPRVAARVITAGGLRAVVAVAAAEAAAAAARCTPPWAAAAAARCPPPWAAVITTGGLRVVAVVAAAEAAAARCPPPRVAARNYLSYWPQLRRAPNSRVFYWNGWRTDSKLRYVSFLFYQKPSLRNRFRCFRTKLRLKERIEICIIFIFIKNLLWEIVSDAFRPNWDCRKESFPTFLVNLSFTYDFFGKNLLWEIV